MKNLIFGFGSAMIILYTILTLTAININTTKENNLENSTKSAIYQTLKECFDETAMPVDTPDQLASNFSENLRLQLNPKKGEKLVIKVLQADNQNGLLSVYVEYTYNNLGYTRTISTQETAVYEHEMTN